MTYVNSDALIDTETLSRLMSAPDVRVVDATWFLPNVNRSGRKEYEACHIPGAVYFDIDEICDSDTKLPHMLPSPEKFSSRVRKLGLGDGNRIVVYDSNGGCMAAHRVWWTFRVFGHEDVAVLDGGLKKWIDEGRPTDDAEPMRRERHFTARVDHSLVRTFDQMLANAESRREQVADARSRGRFEGTAPEPRPGLKSGHIPGSVSLPLNELLDTDNNYTMRPAGDIKAALNRAGIDPKKPLVATCGSGVWACSVAFALYLLGHDRVAVYDGSWTEWGGREDAPVEV